LRTRAEAQYLALPALAWLLGLALLQQCPRLPDEAEFAVLVLAVLACGAFARRSRVALCLAVLLLAFAQGSWRAEQRLAQALPEAWEGRDLLLQGRIASLPSAVLGQAGAPGWRFEFVLEQARGGLTPQDPTLTLPPRLLLSAYGQPGEDAPALRAGERWLLPVRLKRPHGLMNPHAFDYELWLFEQELRATGVVRPNGMQGMQRLSETPLWALDGWRQRMREALQRRVSDPSHAGVLAALSLGDQAAIMVAVNKVVSCSPGERPTSPAVV